MKEPVDHVLRPALPWRVGEPGITECGFDASKVKTITREELTQRYKDYGMTRMSIMTCVTCVQTAERWDDWAKDPRRAIGREVEWEGRWGVRDKHGDRLKRELIAIAQLVACHRDEFEQIMTDAQSQADWLAKKAKSVSDKRQQKSRPKW